MNRCVEDLPGNIAGRRRRLAGYPATFTAGLGGHVRPTREIAVAQPNPLTRSKQHQRKPGLESELTPRPRYRAEAYALGAAAVGR